MNDGVLTELSVYAPVWEYHWADYSTTTSAVGEAAVMLFSKLGSEGWELVQNELLNERRWSRQYRALFKRIASDYIET